MKPLLRAFSTALSLATAAAPAYAQHPPAGGWWVGAHAVGLVTHASPELGGRSATEAYLTQPSIMGGWSARGGAVALLGTLSLEGATIPSGELNAGAYGEGFVDRRHPHTYLHELIATAGAQLGGGALSVAAGKGFAPFGTDDPMVRPFVKYPINHHLAQVLERAVVVAAYRRGPVAIEAGIFNGDEPESPSDWPAADRFGDSWAARTTITLPGAVELQGSYADVPSPEWAAGYGPDQQKWSAALRLDRRSAADRRLYALVEWARSDEFVDGRRSFRFSSALAELAVRRRGIELAARFERTTRPEEQRLDDPFRSLRPHDDNSILGVTRWHVLTAVVSAPVTLPVPLRLRPFVEVARLRATETRQTSAFRPAAFYGSDRLWSLSVGLRLETGHLHHRMGRYGAASSSTLPHHSQ